MIVFSNEENGRLLVELVNRFGATGTGDITHFFDVSPDWYCPSCFRTKQEIARGDKNGKLLCRIVEHHDHLAEHFRGLVAKSEIRWEIVNVVETSFERFARTLICQDCNVAEPVGKLAAGAPSEFSFAPREIADFIRAKPNAPHEVDREAARETFQALKPSLERLAERARATVKAARGSEPEPIGMSVWRVLKDVNAKRKLKDAAE